MPKREDNFYCAFADVYRTCITTRLLVTTPTSPPPPPQKVCIVVAVMIVITIAVELGYNVMKGTEYFVSL